MKLKWTAGIAIILAAAMLFLLKPIIGFTETADEVSEQNSDIKMNAVNPESGLVPGAENDSFILYFDNTTGGIAVEDKVSGNIYYSNPPNAHDDPKASDAAKQQLLSQVELVYNVRGKEGDVSMNSYSQAMLLEQISWGKIDSGIRVSMTVGRAEQRLLLPLMIGKTSFEEDILAKLESEREKKQMQAFYILNPQADIPNATEDVYTLKTSANDRDKRVLEGYVKKAGYTYEMLEAEYETVGYEASETAFPSFAMDIDYILEEDSLSVNLEAGKIQYDKDKFNLVSLSLLNYFGAGETGEEGYIFLPDGSGTMIGFNNDGTKKALLTSGKVYGDDYALTLYQRGSKKQDFRYPVFGIIREDAALMGIIDKGDAIADINGMMGGINHSWNTAYAGFTIKNKDKFIEPGAFEAAPWIIYEGRPYTGNINITYYFLSGSEASYAGMAKAYRQHLINKGILEKVQAKENLPFYLETIGAVDMVVRKLGFPVTTLVPITTFDQAEEMINELTEAGVDNIKLRYKGWYNGGLFYTAPTKMKVERVLGGSKNLAELSEKVSKLNTEVYPDVDFITVSKSSMLDGFSPRKDSIRNLFQKLSFYPELDLPSMVYDYTQWIISPSRVPDYFDRFTKAYDKMNIPNISLSTMGRSISSNFKNNNQVNRQEARGYVTDVLDNAAQKYTGVISDYGNAYILPYTDHILNLPDEDSSFLIADKQVPFIQMVLHGYIPYAGQAINQATELRPAMLRAVEYGSSVYFIMNYGDNSILKAAGVYNLKSSMHFADWKSEAADIYAKMNEALKDVQDQMMVNHEEISDNVFKTTYENGKAIIVNYNDQSVAVEGITVQPLDFAVIKN